MVVNRGQGWGPFLDAQSYGCPVLPLHHDLTGQALHWAPWGSSVTEVDPDIGELRRVQTPQDRVVCEGEKPSAYCALGIRGGEGLVVGV